MHPPGFQDIRPQWHRRTSWGAGLALALMVMGCQVPPAAPGDAKSTPEQARAACEGDLGPAANTLLATIEQQIADGRAYAALAQLDALQATSPKATLLRAEALRRIDRWVDAAEFYRQLESGCMAGRAHHGLGLIAARTGRGADALRELQRARTLLPLDTRVRNDLGYALLLNRRWDEAQFEFMTALDLAPGDGLAARNLVLMAHMQGKPDVAKALGTRFKFDSVTSERLARQAGDLLRQPLGTWLDAPPTSTGAPAALPEIPQPAASEPTVTPLTSPASGAS